MEKPNFEEITKEVEGISKNLKDNARIGEGGITLAFARMISVMGWSSHQSDTNNHQVANLTDEIKDLKKSLEEYSKSANRESRQMRYLTYVIGAITILQLVIAYKQLEYANLQSIPEQISQARSMQQAIEFCKTNPPDTQAPGIYYLDGSGKPALCRDLLR